MSETKILCLVETANLSGSGNAKKSSNPVPAEIKIQKSNGTSKSIMLHQKQDLWFHYGDRVICTKGVVTLTFNPNHRHLSHSVAIGHIGRLKTEVEINEETVSARSLSGPGLKVYTLAGSNNSASGTNK